MAWQYSQTKGQMRSPDGGTIVFTGYAGRGVGKSNPLMQDVPYVGPLPQGIYTMGKAIDSVKLGPVAIQLTPDPSNQMFGRSGFWIHADSTESPGNASDGCIVAEPESVRSMLNASEDRQVQVVP